MSFGGMFIIIFDVGLGGPVGEDGMSLGGSSV
jgi:hypothetical protein